MVQSIVEVQNLNIFGVSGEMESLAATENAYVVEVKTSAPQTEEQLWHAYLWKDEITLRCALLDATGIIKSVRYDGDSRKVYTLKVAEFECRTTV